MEDHSLAAVHLEHRLTVMEERSDAYNRALLLQAEEYERRLSELNHEARRMAERDRLFIPRETFEVFEADLRNWRYTVNQALATVSGRDKGLALAWSFGLGGVALLAGLSGLYAALK